MTKLLYNKKPKLTDKETQIPIFDNQKENVNEFSIKDAAEIHDNALSWLFKTHGVNENELRIELIDKLNLKEGNKILVTATGAGNDLAYISKKIGISGQVYAQDFAKEMLIAAYHRTKKAIDFNKYKIFFSVNDATDLPFNDNEFDATYHFGGINLYKDIKKGIDEMDRVTKPGGKIVFGDEGIAYWLKKTEIAKSLITNNALYNLEPPMSLIPLSAKDVKLSWVINNCFYVIEYIVSDKEWTADINLPHVGKRGGSIKTRHFGKLEGIDPLLRDKFYEKALKKGISRVEYLETLIKKEIKDD
jgi:ubiquinone/menaquinone biosynthesis C-methylase UbiE